MGLVLLRAFFAATKVGKESCVGVRTVSKYSSMRRCAKTGLLVGNGVLGVGGREGMSWLGGVTKPLGMGSSSGVASGLSGSSTLARLGARSSSLLSLPIAQLVSDGFVIG